MSRQILDEERARRALRASRLCRHTHHPIRHVECNVEGTKPTLRPSKPTTGISASHDADLTLNKRSPYLCCCVDLVLFRDAPLPRASTKPLSPSVLNFRLLLIGHMHYNTARDKMTLEPFALQALGLIGLVVLITPETTPDGRNAWPRSKNSYG